VETGDLPGSYTVEGTLAVAMEKLLQRKGATSRTALEMICENKPNGVRQTGQK